MTLRDLTWEVLRAGMARKIKPVDAVVWCVRVHANERGEAWPSDNTMAEELGLTPQEVRDAIGTAIASQDLEASIRQGKNRPLTMYKLVSQRARANLTGALGSQGIPQGTATRVAKEEGIPNGDPRSASAAAHRPAARDGHPISPGDPASDSVPLSGSREGHPIGPASDAESEACGSTVWSEAVEAMHAAGMSDRTAEDRLGRRLRDATASEIVALVADRGVGGDENQVTP